MKVLTSLPIKYMKPHICRKSNTRGCYQLATEPDEECPVHGIGPWPPRCEVCGRFVKRNLVWVEDINIPPPRTEPKPEPTGFFHWIGEKFKKIFL
jgi:hypothetical protein